MIEVSMTFEDGSHLTQRCTLPSVIGRGADCTVRIKHWRVAQRHLQFSCGVDGVYAEDLGSLLGTLINGSRLAKYGPVTVLDKFIVGPCLITVSRIDLTQSKVTSNPPSEQSTVLEQSDPGNGQAGSESCSKDIFDALPVAVLQDLHQSLLKSFDLRKRDISTASELALRHEAHRFLELALQEDMRIDDVGLRELCVKHVAAEALGLGVLEEMLADSDITEIMVNHYAEIFVEREGLIVPHAGRFSSEKALKMVVERVVAPLGRRVDDACPMVDARLADGSRVNVVLPPVSIKGISLTIRKFAKRRLTLNALIKSRALDQNLSEFLAQCVHARLNILIAGGTGAGKTTLLNILANTVSDAQRIITIEDCAELQIDHPHVVSLEARAANIEGVGEISIRDLVKNAMRMRPDRLIVGEVRGAEALDMLLALNTGHDGSFTTIHANSARDAVSRLETLVLLAAPGLGVGVIRQQIASAFHLIVHQHRRASGARGISEVAEVVGVESGMVQLQPFVRYDLNMDRFDYSELPSVHLKSADAMGLGGKSLRADSEFEVNQRLH